MYWFRRPPYLRWTAAALLVIVAAWIDLRPDPVVSHPYAAVDLAAGTALDQTMIDWRSTPEGLLPPLLDLNGTILHPVVAGEPLLPSIISNQRIPAPDGWWILEAQLPDGAVPGQEVQLIMLSTASDDVPRLVPGLVVAPAPAGDPLAIEDTPGLIAVPGDLAGLAAAAIAEGRVSAILGQTTSG